MKKLLKIWNNAAEWLCGFGSDKWVHLVVGAIISFLGFNSTKVRLRRKTGDIYGRGLSLFQFHKGSIKTFILMISNIPPHYVSIPQRFD